MKNPHNSKTYVTLINTFLECLNRQSFESLKVSDICKSANIHRTTFYSYFSDKYDLLNACVSDLSQNFDKELIESNYCSENDFYSKIIMQLLSYIDNNKNFCKNLLFRNDETFFDSLKFSLDNAISKMITHYNLYTNIPLDLASQFYSGAIMSTIGWWVKTDYSVSKENLCKYIVSLLQLP